MNKQTALRLLKDLNQCITMCSNDWGEIKEDDFFIILKNYMEMEKWNKQ